MSDPQPQPQPQPALKPQSCTVLCPECGELTEIHDVEALVRSLHAVNECSVRSLLRQQD